MNTGTTDVVCAGTLSLMLAAYGLWLTIRAMKQIRNPTHIDELGLRWFTSFIVSLSGRKQPGNPEEAFSSPPTVRLVAGLTLLLGVAMMGFPVFLLIMVRWVLQ